MKTPLKVVLPLGALAVGLAGAVALVQFRKEVRPSLPTPLPPLVSAITAQPTNHQYRVFSQGTVEPRTEILLTIEVAGRIEMVSPSLESGGFFGEGDILVKLDARDYELAVVQAEAELQEAHYRLELEEAEAEVAAREWETLGRGAASDLLLRKPQLARARAARAAAEARLEQARRDLDRCTLRAPFDGRTSRKLVDRGQYVSKGTAVARIYSVDYAEVRLPLPGEELAYVDLPLGYRGEEQGGEETAPEVLLRASLAGRPHQWPGVIDRVEGEIDPRTRMLFVVARVEDPYGRGTQADRPPLAPGLFVEAEILGRKVADVFLVSRTALRNGNELLLLDEEDRLWPQQVTVARLNREDAVITRGLEKGDRVCTTPMDVVVRGMKVRTREDADRATVHDEGGEDE